MNDPSEVVTPAETFDHSRARILAALLEAHHTTFYTVISVIQAACFGFLVLVCFEEATHFSISQWFLAANTLMIMVLVWNGFIRGFVVLSYVPKLVDGAMPFALGAAQCFAAYFVAHNVHGWYWSIAGLSFIGCIGYVNAEINARFNPKENSHMLVCFEEATHFSTSQWFLAANTLMIMVLVWNGFIRGFVVLSYVPKLVDGAMPFALGAAQCFAAYFVAHNVHGWYWS